MKEPSDAKTCLFCRRIGEGDVLIAADSAVAVEDGFPVSEGHCLVISRRHVPDFFDLTPREQESMLAMVREVRAMLASAHGFDGLNVGLNIGEAAGQTVVHAHVHVIPRRAGDVADPRGGVRWVLPERAAYWARP